MLEVPPFVWKATFVPVTDEENTGALTPDVTDPVMVKTSVELFQKKFADPPNAPELLNCT
jgi:hypothetical protein